MRTRIHAALERLKVARKFTKSYLEGLEESDWYWQPAPGINNIVWQVGHLAFAEYGLGLRRTRGVLESDDAFMPAAFFQRYRRESLPSGDPAENYTPEETLAVLDAVHAQVLAEATDWTDEALDVPADPPHRLFSTRLGALEWCSEHEMTHAGQIILLRRLRGKPATW